MSESPTNRDTGELSFKDHIFIIYFFIAFYPDEILSYNEKKILERLLLLEVFPGTLSKKEFEHYFSVQTNVWNECETAQDGFDRFEQSLKQVKEMIPNENIIIDPHYGLYPESSKLEKLLRDLVEISTADALDADALKMLQTAASIWEFEVYEDEERVEIVGFMKWDKWDGYGEEMSEEDFVKIKSERGGK